MKKSVKKNCYYKIVSVNSGLAVEETDAGVRMKAPSEQPEQLWKLTSEGRLLNKVSGKCLDIEYGGNTDGCRLHTWEVIENVHSQLWLTEAEDEDHFRIISAFAGKCVDVVGMSTSEGAELQIWEKAIGPNQLWKFESAAAAKKEKAAAKPKASKEEVTVEKPAKKSKTKQSAPAEAIPAEKKKRAPKAKKAEA